jgi:Na+-transporting NADH:ubiquinone oxidoreductase subunit NqrC
MNIEKSFKIVLMFLLCLGLIVFIVKELFYLKALQQCAGKLDKSQNYMVCVAGLNGAESK